MRIAVVGATGRIGAKLTRSLLAAGHHVRALSRGGARLDALARDGAEPFVGSFDTGTGDLGAFFADMDAAFLMVKTDWDNIDDHYAAVAQRFVDALRPSSVRRAVTLSAMGAEVDGKTGHFELFHHLEQKLDELDGIDLVHLRAAWFMENTLAWTDAVARHARIAWYYEPDLKMPWVATADIAAVAATELTATAIAHRTIRELGSHDLSMRDVAAIIARAVGKPVAYRRIDRSRDDIRQVFLQRFGSAALWQDDDRTAAAMNDRVVGFHGDARVRPPLPTTLAAFVAAEWMPAYRQSLDQGEKDETFLTWSAG